MLILMVACTRTEPVIIESHAPSPETQVHLQPGTTPDAPIGVPQDAPAATTAERDTPQEDPPPNNDAVSDPAVTPDVAVPLPLLAQFVAGQYGIYNSVDGLDTPHYLDWLFGQGKIASKDPALIGNLAQYDVPPASVPSPKGIACDFVGRRCYLSSSGYNSIYTWNLDTGDVKLLAGSRDSSKYGTLDGQGDRARFRNPTGLALSPDNKILFVADTGNHMVRKITLESAVVERLVGTGSPGDPDLRSFVFVQSTQSYNLPMGVVTVPIPNGTDYYLYVADTKNSIIKRVLLKDHKFVEDRAVYIDNTLYGYSNGAKVTFSPTHMVVLGNQMYVTDEIARVVWKFDLDSYKSTPTQLVYMTRTPVASQVNRGAILSGPLKGADFRFYRPYGICAMGGKVYVSDYRSHQFIEIDTSTPDFMTTALIKTPAGALGDQGSYADGAFGTSMLSWPYVMACDPIKNEILLSSNGNMVRKLDMTAKTIAPTVGYLAVVPATTGPQTGMNSVLGALNSFTRLDDKSLLVADNCALRKVTFSPDVTVVPWFGSVSANPDNNPSLNTSDPCAVYNKDIPATFTADAAANQILRPAFLVNDGKKYIYVMSITKLLYRIDRDNPVAKEFVAGTNSSIMAQDGQGSGAAFSGLGGDLLYIPEAQADGTTADTLYMVDGNSIRRIELSPDKLGTVTTVFGDPVTTGHVDADGLGARFYLPRHMVLHNVDGKQYIYVTESGNMDVRRIDLQTKQVATLVGNGERETRDGVGMNASFYIPQGIALVTPPDSKADYLYVTDNASKIRMIDLSTLHVTTIVGSGTRASIDKLGPQAGINYVTRLHYFPDLNEVFFTDRNAVRLLAPEIKPDFPVATGQ